MPKTRNHVDYVAHDEPWCRDECSFDDPHRHGFSCNRNCGKCMAICHPDCPAYEESNVKFLEFSFDPQGGFPGSSVESLDKEHKDA